MVCDSCVEIKQGNAVDVIEIDAATNRGIDEIRELRDAARYAPARDKYKVYILDEAHQITEAAFNALLKTLEEPPSHVVFMMATTEPENIPQTIRSRCQHFSFHAVKFDDILAQLRMIAGAEQVEAEDAALALLAEAGDGSMRDALSIMDQAIASAPCNEAGHAVLSGLQIRELMGSVPNAVFERLLEAVAAGQSAELMEQLNVLLNAGHSPSTLARQMVRYLRNALMAKLGGEQTELLQISADERARAARTAMLFTEEDLTRNLQIVLRTFDDLNYRQEQRFHLELGLLKLVHAQRLLPLEELLSGVAAGAPMRSAGAPVRAAGAGSAGGSAVSPLRPENVAKTGHGASSAGPAAAPPVTPSVSPFGSTGGGWGSESKVSGEAKGNSAAVVEAAEFATVEIQPVAAVVEATRPAEGQAVSSPIAMAPFPAASAVAMGFAETVTDGALAKAPETAPPDGSATVDALRQGVVAALANGGHASASQLLGSGNWILDVSSLRIEVAGLGKKMLSLTVNAAAEKIIRQELQRLGGPARFMVVPGEGAGPVAAGQAMPVPVAGSIQEEAMKNPLVQRAKEIFNAEVRSVVDLRTK